MSTRKSTSRRKSPAPPRPRGRPLFGTEAMSETLVCRFTPTQKTALATAARARDISEVELVRRALDAYLGST